MTGIGCAASAVEPQVIGAGALPLDERAAAAGSAGAAAIAAVPQVGAFAGALGIAAEPQLGAFAGIGALGLLPHVGAEGAGEDDENVTGIDEIARGLVNGMTLLAGSGICGGVADSFAAGADIPDTALGAAVATGAAGATGDILDPGDAATIAGEGGRVAAGTVAASLCFGGGSAFADGGAAFAMRESTG